MKKFIIIIILFFNYNLSHADSIVYLDVQFIIDNSILGKFYKKKIDKIQEKNNLDLKKKADQIKKKEKDYNNQKNILSEDQINNKKADLTKLANEYQVFKKKLINENIKTKGKYTSEILKVLNPLLTNYVEKNNIKLVVEKKNILIGIKTLDITNNIIKILDDYTNNNSLVNEN